eukprot:309437-Pelagomonas_calceolata.AAC.1
MQNGPPLIRMALISRPSSQTTWLKVKSHCNSLVVHSPYSLPKYMFLNLPLDVTYSVAQFRLRVHTHCYETGTWNHRSSPNSAFKR